MKLFDMLKNNFPRFTFKNHYGENLTMSATAIYDEVMLDSQKSDYDWIAPAIELVKLCKNPDFPREYAFDIEVAILNCFANKEARVNRGGDKYVDKADNVLAVQYCYDELGRLAQSIEDKEIKDTIRATRTRYLKEMISSAVNTTTRGWFLSCEAFRKLKEEVIAKYFTEYCLLEDFNIKEMYEQISDETDRIFSEAYKSGMFKKGEDEAINIVKMLIGTDSKHHKDFWHDFNGVNTKNNEQETQDVQLSGDENISNI